MRRMGEDVTEQLDYVHASFRVVRHVRPRLSCRSRERIVQAQLPSLPRPAFQRCCASPEPRRPAPPIERGRPGAGLLAHVLVSKYADHLPLYRKHPGRAALLCGKRLRRAVVYLLTLHVRMS